MLMIVLKLYLNICFDVHHTPHLTFTFVQFFCGIIKFAEQQSLQNYNSDNVR